MKQAEIRKNGYKALIDSLGVVGMLRFLQQLEMSTGDYTHLVLKLKCLTLGPLNPPKWGTQEHFKVPHLGGFRGRLGSQTPIHNVFFDLCAHRSPRGAGVGYYSLDKTTLLHILPPDRPNFS
jgi:hypothetical protein